MKTDAPEDQFYVCGDILVGDMNYYDVRREILPNGNKLVPIKGKYKDGYLVSITFKNPGHQKIWIEEPDPDGIRGIDFITCKETFYFDVLDYDVYENAFIKKLINDVTTPNMNALEKIKAVQEYSFFNFKYGDRYKDTYRGTYSVKERGAYFEVQKGDCGNSAEFMSAVAEFLGLKWEARSVGLPRRHVWIAVFYDDEWHDTDGCPNSSWGKLIDPNNVEYVN